MLRAVSNLNQHKMRVDVRIQGNRSMYHTNKGPERERGGREGGRRKREREREIHSNCSIGNMFAGSLSSFVIHGDSQLLAAVIKKRLQPAGNGTY